MKNVWSDHIYLFFHWLLWILVLLLCVTKYAQSHIPICVSKPCTIPSWLSSPCCRLHVYYGVLPHSLHHYFFFFLFTGPTELAFVCKSTLSAHLQDKSECVSLYSPHWCNISVYTSFLYGLPYTILQDKLNRYSYIAGSFDSHWLAQLCELPYSAWHKCSPRASCWKLFHFAMTARKNQ